MTWIFVSLHESDRLHSRRLRVLKRAKFRLLKYFVVNALIRLTLFKFVAHMRQSVFVQTLFHHQFSIFFLVNHPIFALARPSTTVRVQLFNVALVDASVLETTLKCTLVYNHCILHIVACVGNDSHDCICTRRTLIKVVLEMLSSSYQRLLGEENAVNFVVHAERMVVIWSSHCLFGHLALVHIPRRLIVVAERNC